MDYKMKCSYCKSLKSIDGFGGYLHYKSTKECMDSNVERGIFLLVEDGEYEKVYKCKECSTLWKLAEPDFPVAGYLQRD